MDSHLFLMQHSLPLWPDEVAAPSPVALAPTQPVVLVEPPVPAVGIVLPPRVEAAIWRATELGAGVTEVVSTGWAELDRELPGGGWPCRSITEVMQSQPTVSEWRVTGPALRALAKAGGTVVLVGPPKHPYLPGLAHLGVDERHLVWIQAETPSERLYVTEQLIKANAFGAIMSWLPQARQEDLRHLQVCAQACECPVMLFRPEAAQHEASAAPLRLLTSATLDWELEVSILKRKGPRHEGLLRLPSVPGGLDAILTPRLLKPSRLLADRKERAGELLGGSDTGHAARRRVSA